MRSGQKHSNRRRSIHSQVPVAGWLAPVCGHRHTPRHCLLHRHACLVHVLPYPPAARTGTPSAALPLRHTYIRLDLSHYN
eukprot:1542254-Pleurochrysis_carterae.AAC.5